MPNPPAPSTSAKQPSPETSSGSDFLKVGPNTGASQNNTYSDFFDTSSA